MQQIGSALLPVAASVRWLDLYPSESSGADAEDWLHEHDSDGDALVAALDAAPAFVPSNTRDAPDTTNTGEPAEPVREWPAPLADDTDTDDPFALATPSVTAWPAPLASPAYYGVLGDIASKQADVSEADFAAILFSLLVAVGNVIGRSPGFRVEADAHHTNLNALIVGPTAGGRKGVGLGRAREVIQHIDPVWAKTRILSGLSSGEGLIWNVRDPIKDYTVDKKTGVGEWVTTDPGIEDRRLLVVEQEFASVLRQCRRDGNTLSPQLRLAWDGGTLRSLTKNSPATATDAHVSLIAHITQAELLKEASETDALNGLLNRWMFVAARRTRYLPDGGETVDLANEIATLQHVITESRRFGTMRRDDAARALWHDVYPALTEDRPGIVGALLARAAPIVLRLSMIYAIADGTGTIGEAHLQAALACWRYCEDSVRWAFGDKLGDTTADTVLAALRAAPDGLTRTAIFSDVFKRNAPAEEITRALVSLARSSLVSCERIAPEGGKGRPSERWHATRVQERDA